MVVSRIDRNIELTKTTLTAAFDDTFIMGPLGSVSTRTQEA